MPGLFVAHLGEEPGAGRIVVAEALGEVGVDALVLLFQRDCEGQNLPLGEVLGIASRRARFYPLAVTNRG